MRWHLLDGVPKGDFKLEHPERQKRYYWHDDLKDYRMYLQRARMSAVRVQG